MAHTFTQLAYHVVYSTKERREFLHEDLMNRLVPYVGGMIRQRDGTLLAMNGSPNHVHLLCHFPATVAISKQVQEIKAISSAWIKDTPPNLRLFAWQEGYAAFTLGLEGTKAVERYIANQPQRHRKQSFEDELMGMLARAGIEYDPRFVFG